MKKWLIIAMVGVGVVLCTISAARAATLPSGAPAAPVADPPPTVSAIVITREAPVAPPATTVAYIDRVIPVPQQLHTWDSKAALEDWLGLKAATRKTLFFTKKDRASCSDYALQLQTDAEADGYQLSFQIIEPETYNNMFHMAQIPAGTLHAIDLAIIGDYAYYIEPQTDEVVLAAALN